MPPTLGEDVGALGWCTGSVIENDAVPLISARLTGPGTPPEISPKDWLVVVSQTCDVVAKTIGQEPFVEILHCRPVKKIRKRATEALLTRFTTDRSDRR